MQLRPSTDVVLKKLASDGLTEHVVTQINKELTEVDQVISEQYGSYGGSTVCDAETRRYNDATFTRQAVLRKLYAYRNPENQAIIDLILSKHSGQQPNEAQQSANQSLSITEEAA